jgi:precorrin-2 dehydrogenase/sirohydrochlorin ferrochelatase
MTLYPVFLKLEHHKVLVVGGGNIAEQKLEGLLRSAADITVIAPTLNARIAQWQTEGRIHHIPQEYQSEMAQGYFLVIAATDSPAINHQVYDEGKRSGALCNAVDDPPYCDFYASALVSRGDFQIAISTAGHSPALAQRVRKKLELEYGPEYEDWITWLGRMRTAFRSVLPRTERRKELLHLLAMLRPAGRRQHQTYSGDQHGPFAADRT